MFRVITSCLLARAAALAPATARPPRNSATAPWDPLDYIQTAGGVANKLHPVLNHLPPAPARVLDIGCTLGPDLMRSGYDVRGMDVDARQVANARVRGVPAVIGDAQVCFPPELRPRALFDAVVSLDALHHMPHHASVVNNVASVLKTEGVFAGDGAQIKFHGASTSSRRRLFDGILHTGRRMRRRRLLFRSARGGG